jgi:Transglycosylase-like domain
MPKSRTRLLFVVAISLLVLAGAHPVLAASSTESRQLAAVQLKIQHLRKQQFKHKSVINWWNNRGHWALGLGHPRCSHFIGKKRKAVCFKSRRSLAIHSRRLAVVEKRLTRLTASILEVGNLNDWICIHHGEGAWNDNTGNGYYGGLQMDYTFMSSYGPKVLGFDSAQEMFSKRGTADHWTPKEQIAVAEYARSSGRGYRPWPKTARHCGLLR